MLGKMGGDEADRVRPGERMGGSGEAGMDGRKGSRKELRKEGDGEARDRRAVPFAEDE